MRKAERLFQLVTLLRGRKQVLTAESIASSLNVSVRTIYRDIQALCSSGVPIDGEAGVGYRLSPSFSLPPVMFDEKEVTALILALKMVKAHSDSILSQGANKAEDKILAILPERMKATINSLPYHVPDFSNSREETKWHTVLRESCIQRNRIVVTYTDSKEKKTERELWPLGLLFWGPSWTLIAWCALRQDYRNFRLDRFLEIKKLDEQYPVNCGYSVEHYCEINGYC